MTVEYVLFATIMRMVEHQSAKFSVFSLVIREFETTETGSHLTAPSATQSGMLPYTMEKR